MAKAKIENGILIVEIPFDEQGRTTASRKNVTHATTDNQAERLVVNHKGTSVTIQLNAFSKRVEVATPDAEEKLAALRAAKGKKVAKKVAEPVAA